MLIILLLKIGSEKKKNIFNIFWYYNSSRFSNFDIFDKQSYSFPKILYSLYIFFHLRDN